MTNHKLLKGADFGLLFFIYFIGCKTKTKRQIPDKTGDKLGEKRGGLYILHNNQLTNFQVL